MAGGEGVDLGLGGLERFVIAHDLAQRLLDDVPQLLVGVAEQHDGALRLGVERARHLHGDVLDGLDDLLIADRGFGGQRVLRATGLEFLDEVRHDGILSRWHCVCCFAVF